MNRFSNILALLDLSGNLTSVIETAAEFSQKFDAKLILYHASPNTKGDEQIHSLRENIRDEIKNIIDADRVEPRIQITVASEDFPGGTLLEQMISDADLIVMGSGKMKNGDARKEKIIKIVDDSSQPVLVVPEDGKVGHLEHILYCSSYEDLASNEPLEIVKLFASEYNSEVRVAHVKTHSGKPNMEHVERSREEGAFFEPEVKYSYKLIRSGDVIDGISHYIRRKGDNNMVVMIRRKHHIFERIFGKNFTFRMLQSTEIPLLILKEPQLN